MLILGCGNRDRGDDAAGVLVAERLRDLGLDAQICSGQALELIDAWNGADDVVIVDAVITGGPAGKVWLWDSEQLPLAESLSLSTHGFGIVEGIQLARILGCLPKCLRVFGIEGSRFELGSTLSPEVMYAVNEVVVHITGVSETTVLFGKFADSVHTGKTLGTGGRSLSDIARARIDIYTMESAHRRLLHPVGFAKILHHRPVIARLEPAHQLVPHRVLQRPAPLKHFVTAQPLLAILRRAQTGALDRHLLPIHHAVARFFAMRPPRRMLLMPLPGQITHLFLHHQTHQRQPGLAHHVPDSFLQKTHHLGQGNDHVEVGISFVGQLPELLHRPLLVDLISFLHSDSLLFFGRKNSIIMTAVESRYFLRINGHPPLSERRAFSMTANGPIPAAQYLRMSTEDQPNSIPLQQQAIESYAKSHGFQVIATYADPGKSGVEIRHRPGLRQLIQDVVGGNAYYRAILVYDVSRWGRFQDTDESAHYEFLCRSAGVPIHYCAEQFDNDGRMASAILKAVKRTMAAEFSRELSAKVYAGQRHVVSNGFWGGSTAGYGLRRMMISSDGLRRQILGLHEHKNIRSDHVVLVPGPRNEVDCIRTIFSLAESGFTPREIAEELNLRGIQYIDAKRWTKLNVFLILKNEKYVGRNVWGRTAKPFGRSTIKKPRGEWVNKSDAFVPLISQERFARVQELIQGRNYHIRRSDSFFLDEMRRVLKQEGKLSQKLLKKKSVFDYRVFMNHFGSMMHAYELVGYRPAVSVFKANDGYRSAQKLRTCLLRQLSELFPSQLRVIHRPFQSCRRGLELDNGLQVAIHMCRPMKPTLHGPRWILFGNRWEKDLVCLICLPNPAYTAFSGLYVVPEIGSVLRRYKILHEHHPLLMAGKRLESVSQFYEVARQVSENWKSHKDLIVVGDATLHERKSVLTLPGKQLKLSRIEATIFKVLLRNAGTVVSASQMSSCPGGPNEWFARGHISALRKKLGPKLRKRLITVLNKGYMYKPQAA
ncbi:MAG: hydrogenase maturation protease [Candidatus Sulfotelmatobacter sp.]